MYRKLISFVLPALFITLLIASCLQNTDQQKATKIRLLLDEKWWGGAVVDGRNSPYSDSIFVYDQNGDCKGNQAQP